MSRAVHCAHCPSLLVQTVGYNSGLSSGAGRAEAGRGRALAAGDIAPATRRASRGVVAAVAGDAGRALSCQQPQQPRERTAPIARDGLRTRRAPEPLSMPVSRPRVCDCDRSRLTEPERAPVAPDASRVYGRPARPGSSNTAGLASPWAVWSGAVRSGSNAWPLIVDGSACASCDRQSHGQGRERT